MNLYKSQVLSYIESSVLGYYYAASIALHPLDRVQERLCWEFGISHEAVLLRYKLVPLQRTRDMALLGLLHRIVFKDVRRQLAEMFPRARAWPCNIATTRLQIRRHNWQLWQHAIGTETLRRSSFGLVKIYNLLSQHVIDVKSVQLL